MDQVLQALAGLEERIICHVDEKIDGLRNEMNGHFDAIYKRLEKLEVEYQLIVVALRAIEKRLDNLEREFLKADLAGLRAKVADLTSRIAQIEAQLDSTKPS